MISSDDNYDYEISNPSPEQTDTTEAVFIKTQSQNAVCWAKSVHFEEFAPNDFAQLTSYIIGTREALAIDVM